MRIFNHLIALAVIPMASRLALSQQPVSDTVQSDTVRRSVQLRAVTITAAPADRREASTATHVSQAQMQETPANDPWDLLRQAAGLEVHLQGQGPGFASDASVRGFSSDHSTDLALWIDGVPVNEPVNGHAEGYNDWSLIFPASVQDVDVIKGPTSALFGNFALSGVVNVRTLERTSVTQTDLSGGNFGRGEGTFLTGFDHGSDGGGVFGLRVRHDDGFRPNSRNDLTQAHARVVRDVTTGTTLDAGIELYGARWDSPGYLSEHEFTDQEYDIVSNPSDGGYKRHAQGRLSLRVIRDNILWRTTGYATQGRWQLFLTIPPAGGKFEGTGSQTEEEDSRYGYGLTSAVTWGTPAFDITLGGEGRFDHSNYQNYFTTIRQRDSADVLVSGQQLSGGLFLQSAFDVGERVRIDLGGRYDGLRTTSMPDDPTAGDVKATHGVFSPKAGAIVHVLSGFGVYGNVSRGFRSTDGVLEDPTLVPITTWAYETGIKLDTAGVRASIAAFRMNVSNEQTFNPLTSGSISGGSSRRQGIELDVTTPVTRVALVSTLWTLNDARYTRQLAEPEDPVSLPVNLAGRRVYNTARYIGCATLDLRNDDGVPAGRWSLRFAGNWVGPYSPFDEPGVLLGGYGLMHASGRVRLSRAVVLDAGVRNVLDRAYPEVVAGHIVSPGEPRSVYASLRYRL